MDALSVENLTRLLAEADGAVTVVPADPRFPPIPRAATVGQQRVIELVGLVSPITRAYLKLMAEHAELHASYEELRALHGADLLHQRGVRVPCEKCRGAGVCRYPGGQTWRGGMGTARATWDTCDRCWGTGDEVRRGVNLRSVIDALQVAQSRLNGSGE